MLGSQRSASTESRRRLQAAFDDDDVDVPLPGGATLEAAVAVNQSMAAGEPVELDTVRS
jgi:hypothetical protein